jgi:hypothetical protein
MFVEGFGDFFVAGILKVSFYGEFGDFLRKFWKYFVELLGSKFCEDFEEFCEDFEEFCEDFEKIL